MSLRRVAITGIGILSSLGRGKDEHLDAVRGSRSGVAPIDRFDTSGFRCTIAAQVPERALGDLPREVDRVTGYALLAAADAIEQARLGESPVPGERIATAIGTALGGSETLEASYARLYGKGETRFHPMTIPRVMYNAPTSAVSARWNARGPAFAPVSACASSAHAIGQAAHWIRFGLADAAIAGGADAPITPGIVRAWEALRVLAPPDPSPAAACRPFNRDRAGLVLGEGAAILVLEEMDAARARGATILGELAGFGMTADAGHLTDPSTEGEARAMRIALDDGGVDP
ncbi:MAG TPA: beta-ketoacyl-[acyl-carrier-protein] synthase family protein, partial [Thermoanaerobaculia bacterium]|nr:beta-ketoacyl-[acyl-carrier-protein] synthase family protein [Thermoanaerobaculia bacterium]